MSQMHSIRLFNYTDKSIMDTCYEINYRQIYIYIYTFLIYQIYYWRSNFHLFLYQLVDNDSLGCAF